MNQALKKTYRTQLTKLVDRANEMSDDNAPVDHKEAIVLINRLKSVNDSLKRVNIEVASEIPVDKIESECEKIIEYEDKAVAAIARLEFELSSAGGKYAASIVDAEEDVGSITAEGRAARAASTRAETKRAVRLPKLELVKFNGDYKMWPAFWEQFETAVHNNNDLGESSKFTYLKSVLTGNASITVQGLTSSSSSYKDAVELLKEQYGNNEKIADNYTQQLLALTPVKTTNDVSLRKLYNTASKITRSLQTLGVSPQNYGMMVKSILLKALPFTMRTEFLKRQVTTNDNDDNESVAGSVISSKEISYEHQISQLLNFIKLEVESIEQAKVLEDEPKSNEKNSVHKNRFQKSSDKTCTAAGLLTSVKEQCLFCNSNDHGAMDCDSKITLAQKKEILKSKGCCFRCTKSNHNSRFCRVNVSCAKCKAKHATSMCDPDYKKKSATVTESTKNDASSSKFESTNLLANGCLGKIIYLQTACAQIITNSGVPKSFLRMVIDGGSHLTFIKECVSRKHNLPVIGTHKISIMPFGKSERAPARLCRKVSLTLKSEYINDEVTINAIEVPEICFDSLSAPSLKEPLIHEFSINYRLADLCDSNVNVHHGISLLIGSDFYWKIVTNNTKKITEDLMAIETKFG
ncbi:uncharacterized protein LOC116179570 [Photinus pyralis]|uniref:uncharacterized protein LOC116179570 n=1 Tax=Photinus pyralis TaxID=7054 RepID=UPI0012670034|nr:uncharacterized protein LOC116179570 [Photinus pyralis]